MKHTVRAAFAGIVLSVTVISAEMVDSLPLEGHYSQGGVELSRRDMEQVLLEEPVAHVLVDRAKGLRIASNVLGISTWCISAGITAYQLVGFIDAIERQKPYSNELDDLVLPLAIGGEIASLLQSRLRARADYLFRKGAVEYNRQLCRRTGSDRTLDHRIKEVGNGWYTQDGILMSPSTLHYVLGEERVSRGHSMRSVFYRQTSSNAIGMGVSLLLLALMSGIDDQPYRGYLISGSCTTGFGIVNLIAAAVARKRAIRVYNEAVAETVPCYRRSEQPAEDTTPPQR
ncbi:MAG: hypothetical protein GF331_26845 [Chitinivibrionales bacterium]|nr:hypothetical protein [Chitinivibrionales bacterium]